MKPTDTQDPTFQDLKEELFCTRYELELLAGQVAGRGLERWIEGFSPAGVETEHLQRYKFATRFTSGLKVLDIACGTGRGTRMLVEEGKAAAAVGLDIESKAIRYATFRNGHPTVTYAVGNGLESIFQEEEFDAAICFETIEHVHQPELFLLNLSRALKKGGRLVISTPVAKIPLDLKPGNPHHVQEWDCTTFKKLLSEAFLVQSLHLQYIKVLPQSLMRSVFRRIRAAVGAPRPVQSMDSVWIDCSGFDPEKNVPHHHWVGYQIWVCAPV